MADIRPYTDRVTAQGQLAVQSNPNDFGANIGAAVQNVGNAGMEYADVLYRNEVQNDVTNVHVEMAKKRAEWQQKLTELANQTKPGDDTFVPRVMDSIQQEFEGMSQSVKTRQGQQTFAKMSADMTGMFGQEAIGIQSRLNGEFAKNQYLDMSKSLGTVAAQDHTQVESLVKQGVATIDDPNGRFARVPESTREAFRASIKEEIEYNAAKGFARRYPNAVLGQVPNEVRSQVQQAVAKPPTPGLPPDLKADTVKPYDQNKIDFIAKRVAQPSPYDQAFKDAAQLYNLDWRELKMRSVAESNLDANAKGPAVGANGNATLPKGWTLAGGTPQSVKGMVEPGNIDLTKRPKVKNEDGSISTVRSMGVNIDGQEVLIPTVVNGKVVSEEEAIAHYKRTGENLGKFSSAAASDAYAKTLHDQQEKFYVTSTQAGGIMQFTPETAAQLGVDRNDPVASIYAAAKLVAGYRTKAGGDMSKVDMMYYGGAAGTAWGPNTKQYAANLAAARGAVGLGTGIAPEQFAPSPTAETGKSQDWVKPKTGIGFIDNLPADKFFSILTEAEHYQRAYDSQAERNRIELKHQQQVAAESAMDMYTQRIVNPTQANGGKLSEVEVVSNPLLNSTQKQHILGYMNQYTREQQARQEPKSNPAAVRELMLRIHAPDNDSAKIYNNEPIYQALSEGRISTSEFAYLNKEVTELRSSSTNGFRRDVNNMRGQVARALQQNVQLQGLEMAEPGTIADIAYRFDRDLESKIEALRKENKDPSVLLDPTSREYVLRPGRLQQFFPGNQVVANAASNAAASQASQLPTYQDYDKLKKGDSYTDPQGNVRVKR